MDDAIVHPANFFPTVIVRETATQRVTRREVTHD